MQKNKSKISNKREYILLVENLYVSRSMSSALY